MNDAPKDQDVNQAGALRGEPEAVGRVQWPKGRDVRRRSDMDQGSVLQITLDADNDVCVGLWGDHGYAGVEFCNAFSGGGKSPRTREALIGVMRAMEEDAATAAEGGAS